MTTPRFRRRLTALLLLACALPATAADWIHWRGPTQNGVSPDTGIPGEFGVTEVGKRNLIWRSDIGGRSTPLVMNGHLYLITASGSGLTEGERVVCLKESTGELVWENKFNVFHTDIVSSRLGWTCLAADPASGTIYCHGTQGHVFAYDAKTGAVKWHRNLTEEFGRITGYGGRISSPLFDDGLVIVGFVNSSWGTQARGGNRYFAFDGKTGEVVWITDVSNPPSRAMKGTYYSNSVIANINGQRLLVTGGADGGVHALKVRSGEIVWTHPFAVNIINSSPIVDGNLVYISHGEENIGGGPIGKVICLDASQVNAKTKQPKVVWETKRIQIPSGGSRQGVRFGLATPALSNGVLYLPDDAGELYAFNAKDGKCLWTHKFGTVSRGAPLVVDGKLFVFDVNAKLTALKLNGTDEPEILAEIPFRSTVGAGFVETHGTPIAVNGRLYFCTREFTYCIGDANGKGGTAAAAGAAETPFDENAAPASLRIFPAEISTAPGQTVNFSVKFLDTNGREVKAPADAKIEWSLPQPPAPTPMAAQPPALNGVLKADGAKASVEIAKMPNQQGYVSVKAGTLSTPVGNWARVRVVPQVPYTNDFEKVPENVAPGGWVNANAKFFVKKLADGNKVLAKVNTDSRPPFARSNAFITATTAKAYAIECDLFGTKVRDQFPDMGVVNSRYLMVLDGKPDSNFNDKKTLRLVSWEARLRVNKAVEFDWKPDVWYTLKLVIEPTAKGADIKGKVWEKGKPEPKAWSLEFNDPSPNLEGAAALYGYVTNIQDPMPGSEIHYDNLKITPAAKK